MRQCCIALWRRWPPCRAGRGGLAEAVLQCPVAALALLQSGLAAQGLRGQLPPAGDIRVI